MNNYTPSDCAKTSCSASVRETNKFLTEEGKILVEAGFIYGSGEYTGALHDLMLRLLFEQNKEAILAEAKKRIEERK